MTEGGYPKVNGDAIYASEVNKFLQIDKNLFTGADGALSITSGTTNISGLKNYSSMSITGGTMNISDWSMIYVNGSVSISGSPTITASSISSSGYSNPTNGENGHDSFYNFASGMDTATEGGAGGAPKYPLIVFINGNLSITGGTFTFTGGNGSNGGSAGSKSSASNGAGGGGGGYFVPGAAGSNGTNVLGGNPGGSSGMMQFVVLQNLLSYPFQLSPGFGGTGGYGYSQGSGGATAHSGGGGGASGSMVYFYVLGNVSISGATFNLAAGSGGTISGGAAGGQGAGGAFVCLYTGTYSNSATITLTGATTGLTITKNIGLIAGTANV